MSSTQDTQRHTRARPGSKTTKRRASGVYQGATEGWTFKWGEVGVMN